MKTALLLIFLALGAAAAAQEGGPIQPRLDIPNLELRSLPQATGQGPVLWTDNQPFGFTAGQAPFSDQAAPMNLQKESFQPDSQQIPEPQLTGLIGAGGLAFLLSRRRNRQADYTRL